MRARRASWTDGPIQHVVEPDCAQRTYRYLDGERHVGSGERTGNVTYARDGCPDQGGVWLRQREGRKGSKSRLGSVENAGCSSANQTVTLTLPTPPLCHAGEYEDNGGYGICDEQQRHPVDEVPRAHFLAGDGHRQEAAGGPADGAEEKEQELDAVEAPALVGSIPPERVVSQQVYGDELRDEGYVLQGFERRELAVVQAKWVDDGEIDPSPGNQG